MSASARESVSDTTLINKVYADATRLIKTGQLDSCIHYIDEQSLAYFKNLGKVICCGSKEDILKLDPTDLFISVYSKADFIHRNVPVDTAQPFILETLMRMSKEQNAVAGITKLSIIDNWATATKTLGGQETDDVVYFKKENGTWKVNMTTDIEQSKGMNNTILMQYNNSKENIISDLAQRSGVSVELLIQPLSVK